MEHGTIKKEVPNDFGLFNNQQEALDNIINWYFDPKSTISRSFRGFAGSGKSFTLGKLIDHPKMSKVNVTFAAPTHKACKVLSENTGREVSTLHSLLSMSPAVDLASFNPDKPEFKPRGNSSIYPGLVIVDECSMINEKLYEYLEKECSAVNAKILFVGDPAQLPPIGEKLSITFRIEGDELNIVRRTDSSAILKACTYIRNNQYEDNLDFEQFLDNKTFIDIGYKEFGKLIPELYSNPLASKYIAFTNDRVNAANIAIRQKLFGKKCDKFVIGDIIMPFKSGTSKDYGKQSNRKKFNSYVNSEDLMIQDIHDSEFIISRNDFGFCCYGLECINEYNQVKYINVLKESEYQKFLSFYQDQVKTIKYLESKKRAQEWSYIFSIQSNLLVTDTLGNNYGPKYYKSVNYGYAITSHRAQGSGYKNVFIDTDDIYKCRDTWTRNRMLYVAISRAKEKVFNLI